MSERDISEINNGNRNAASSGTKLKQAVDSSNKVVGNTPTFGKTVNFSALAPVPVDPDMARSAAPTPHDSDDDAEAAEEHGQNNANSIAPVSDVEAINSTTTTSHSGDGARLENEGNDGDALDDIGGGGGGDGNDDAADNNNSGEGKDGDGGTDDIVPVEEVRAIDTASGIDAEQTVDVFDGGGGGGDEEEEREGEGEENGDGGGGGDEEEEEGNAHTAESNTPVKRKLIEMRSNFHTQTKSFSEKELKGCESKVRKFLENLDADDVPNRLAANKLLADILEKLVDSYVTKSDRLLSKHKKGWQLEELKEVHAAGTKLFEALEELGKLYPVTDEDLQNDAEASIEATASGISKIVAGAVLHLSPGLDSVASLAYDAFTYTDIWDRLWGCAKAIPVRHDIFSSAKKVSPKPVDSARQQLLEFAGSENHTDVTSDSAGVEMVAMNPVAKHDPNLYSYRAPREDAPCGVKGWNRQPGWARFIEIVLFRMVAYPAVAAAAVVIFGTLIEALLSYYYFNDIGEFSVAASGLLQASAAEPTFIHPEFVLNNIGLWVNSYMQSAAIPAGEQFIVAPLGESTVDCRFNGKAVNGSGINGSSYFLPNTGDNLVCLTSSTMQIGPFSLLNNYTLDWIVPFSVPFKVTAGDPVVQSTTHMAVTTRIPTTPHITTPAKGSFGACTLNYAVAAAEAETYKVAAGKAETCSMDLGSKKPANECVATLAVVPGSALTYACTDKSVLSVNGAAATVNGTTVVAAGETAKLAASNPTGGTPVYVDAVAAAASLGSCSISANGEVLCNVDFNAGEQVAACTAIEQVPAIAAMSVACLDGATGSLAGGTPQATFSFNAGSGQSQEVDLNAASGPKTQSVVVQSAQQQLGTLTYVNSARVTVTVDIMEAEIATYDALPFSAFTEDTTLSGTPVVCARPVVNTTFVGSTVATDTLASGGDRFVCTAGSSKTTVLSSGRRRSLRGGDDVAAVKGEAQSGPAGFFGSVYAALQDIQRAAVGMNK